MLGCLARWARSYGTVPAPSLTSANYNVFDSAGGDSITLTGTNLSGATSVSDGTNTYTITGNTATTVTVTTPATTAGTKNVTVTTSAGTSNALSLKAWAPSSISGAAHAWLADRGVTLVSSAVSQLDDQIGTAHMVQANVPDRPTLTNSANYGGKQVLSHALQSLSISSMPQMSSPITVLFVGHASVAGRSLVSSADNMFWRITSGAMEFFKVSGAARYASGASTATSAAAWRFSDDGASGLILAKNDLATNIGSITSGTPSWTPTITMGIGRTQSGVGALTGEFAELILVSGVISSGDRADYAVRTALRYGLPVTG